VENFIDLSQGYSAIVDAEDIPTLLDYSWKVKLGKKKEPRAAIAFVKRRPIYMHRLVLGLTESDPEVDHINRNPLDNRKSNLRLATRKLQNLNSTRRIGKFGYRGVYQHKESSRFVARIKINKQMTHLGTFDTSEEAALMFDIIAKEIHGEHANTNF
jgi:hypothetical protein